MIMHTANDPPIRVAVLGASGYSGGELLDVLEDEGPPANAAANLPEVPS